jgi:DNA-binding LacI/PurR family transcriptional regulator
MKPKNPVVNLRHIAERVGVSRITVSMALRDDGRISEVTRERVRAVAKELGYTPNPRIGALMAETSRTRHGVSGETLAYVTSEPTRDGWKRFGTGCYETVERRAAEHGYRLEPWWIADPAQTPARLNQILWSRGVRGVIIPNISHQCFADWGGTLPIEWERFSVVEIGGSLRRPLVNQVFHDHQAGLFMALDELEALGYRRIGLCLKSEDDLRTHHRWTGAYFVWRSLRGYESVLHPLIVDELTPALVRQWVRTNRVEAVVSPGVLPLNEWGFNVPVKLGFASLHMWGKETEGLTGIDQESDGIEAAAVDMLVTLLHRNQRGVPAHPVRWMLRGRWVAGETTRQIRPVRVRPVGIENELLANPSV